MTANHFSKTVFAAALITALAFHTAFAAQEILVGATVSRHGTFIAPSRMLQLSYRLWEKQVNKAGGLLGRPVRLILYDDESNKELVRTYYEKLIVEDKVDLVLAPYSSTLTYEASAVTERHGYVMLASAAAGGMIWDRGYHYIFGVFSLAERHFIGFLDLAAGNGLRSMAVISEDRLFTKNAAQGAVTWAWRFGLDVKLAQTYGDGPHEFPGLIKRLENTNPDVLVLCSYPPDGYLFLEQLRESSYRPKGLAMTVTPGLPDFGEKAGDMAEGIFCPSQWEPDEHIPFPGTAQFIEAFTSFAGTKPSFHAGAAFATCQLLKASIEALGKIDHASMRDYIASLDTTTVIGRFKVDPQGRQIGHNTIIIQWQKGKKEIVYPRKLQTSPPVFGTLNDAGK